MMGLGITELQLKIANRLRLGHGVAGWPESAIKRRWVKRQSRRPVLEALEQRRLLATITEYPTSSATVVPTEITTGSDGNIWFIQQAGNSIGRINPTTHVIDSFSNGLPANSNLIGITSGPNGKVWFTEGALFANAIGTIDPNNTGQAIQNFGSAAGMSARAVPTGIAAAGNALWFTQPLNDKIGKLDTTTGKITEFAAPAAIHSLSSQIVLGPDGNLWFTEFGAIGVLNPATGAVIKEIPLPGGSLKQPFDLTAGPDGNIWYTAGLQNAAHTGFVSYAVGIINTSLQSFVKEIPLSATTQPYRITAGPDGKIWYTVSATQTIAGTINQIDPATQTVTQTLAIPTNVIAIPNPVAITAGPDGNLWFTDSKGAIGVVDLDIQPQFVVTAAPSGVTAGQGFGLTVTAQYGSGIVNTLFNGNVTISLANIPSGGSSTLGGTLTVQAVKGVATFSGLILDKAASGYTLRAASSGVGAPAAVTTSPFNVTGPNNPPPPPITPAPTITGASVVLIRKLNKKGKPIGKPILSGYTVTFSTDMDQTSLANRANYQIALKVIKRVKVGNKRVPRTSLKPIGFSVAQFTSKSVTLKLAGNQKFPKGGQLTIIATPPDGVDSTSHVFLERDGILPISTKGTRITLPS